MKNVCMSYEERERERAWIRFSSLVKWDLLAKRSPWKVSMTLTFALLHYGNHILLFQKIKRTKLLFMQECFMLGAAVWSESVNWSENVNSEGTTRRLLIIWSLPITQISIWSHTTQPTYDRRLHIFQQEMKSKHNMTVANITEPDMDHMPYNAAVVYHKLEFILSNLKHFEEYSIEVRLYILFPSILPGFFWTSIRWTAGKTC